MIERVGGRHLVVGAFNIPVVECMYFRLRTAISISPMFVGFIWPLTGSGISPLSNICCISRCTMHDTCYTNNSRPIKDLARDKNNIEPMTNSTHLPFEKYCLMWPPTYFIVNCWVLTSVHLAIHTHTKLATALQKHHMQFRHPPHVRRTP